MDKEKFILDACCGGRMMWFNKNHPNALYIDIRKTEKGFVKSRPNFKVNPDLLMDFRELNFQDKSFKLIVFDPPHIKKLGPNGIFAKKYGKLDENWRYDLKKGFDECWRVLEDYGVLIFKWCEYEIKTKEILGVLGKVPLFGHPTSKGGTHWFCFMKIPEEQNETSN